MAPAKTKSNPLGSGRKERVAGELSSTVVAIRLTPSERKAYEAAAAIKGLKLGDWIRFACSRLAKPGKVKR